MNGDIAGRVASLIADGTVLATGTDEYGSCRDAAHIADCVGWLGGADHAVALVCPNPQHPYREAAGRIIEQSRRSGAVMNQRVGEFVAVLRRLSADIQAGLLASVTNAARAETLDDLLDDAEQYAKQGNKAGAAVLSTAVFEDAIRRIARLNGVAEAGVSIEDLFAGLVKVDVLTQIVAKRCRAAAGVRNSALHAHWDDFSERDVASVVTLTREVVGTHLAT